MDNLTQLINDNNFKINDIDEISKSFEFDNEDEAYDALFKINQHTSVNVSLNINDIEDSEDEEVEAQFFFTSEDISYEEVNITMEAIALVA